MNIIIAKYVEAFHQEQGTATEKTKKILMRYGHTWDWTSSESLIADLIDDSNITAEDIVDVLANAYEMEGGNEEFHYAVRALQICLRKAQLAETVHHHDLEEDFDHDEADDADHFHLHRDLAHLHHNHMKY